MERDSEGLLQHWVSFVLRAGVIASAVVGVAGWIFYLSAHAGDKVAYQTFKVEPEKYRLAGPILHSASQLDIRSIMLVGILLLILTPVTRVFVSLIGFIKEKDRTYVVITILVLLLLLGSLISGNVHG